MPDLPTAADSATPAGPPLRALLFDVASAGGDRELTLAELSALEPGERQMVWVDLHGADAALRAEVRRALALPEITFNGNGHPAVLNLGEHFGVRVITARGTTTQGFEGDVLDVIAGPNFVVTVHDAPIAFLDRLRESGSGRADIGMLSAESFVAAVLDWHLSTYFDAVSAFEMAVERLEMEIFDDRHQDCLGELRELRRGASRLRRMLAPHRTVFGAMSRPDFRPGESRAEDRHFQALDVRFERAMDMVENCRDLVMGSFELFSNQTALRTNRTMHVLTFATVVLGVLALTAGVLGMNFRAGFFEHENGFWYAASGLLLLGVLALGVGRWRRWF
jgi:magnesium transporter